jgi:transposase-like protein
LHVDELATKFRSGVAALHQRGRRRPGYPSDLKALAKQYTELATDAGRTRQQIARSLGIDPNTVRAWAGPRKEKKAPQGMRRVEVVETAEPRPKNNLVVRGPNGLTVEGLDINGVVQLLRALG